MLARLMAGFEIFIAIEPNVDMSAEHDIVYCGTLELKDKMTPDQLAVLEKTGWSEDASLGCWYHFT